MIATADIENLFVNVTNTNAKSMIASAKVTNAIAKSVNALANVTNDY